jgi:hypothetical protein
VFILVILLILNGHTADARIMGRSPTDSDADKVKCEAAGKELIEQLGPAPDGMHAEARCVHVDAPPALEVTEE